MTRLPYSQCMLHALIILGCYQISAFTLKKTIVSSYARKLAYDTCRLASTARYSTRNASHPQANESEAPDPWAKRALLISSFADGVVKSPRAQAFLRLSLAESIMAESQIDAEDAVSKSVLTSPCNGPDVEALNLLESLDEVNETMQDGPEQIKKFLEHHQLRFLYIPTAMYALRAESKRSPGQNRQRARADGKKRRNKIVNELHSLLGDDVQVLSATLDLDDGSIKQTDGSDDSSLFPKNGKEALKEWSPHFIYVDGGNTFWLHHCMMKGDWGYDIVNACTGTNWAVYGGLSAGAIVSGSMVDTATWKKLDDPTVVLGMEQYSDWKAVRGLNLVGDNSFFPHMNEDLEILVAEKRKELSNVYYLRDNDACCVNGEKKLIFIASS